MWVQVHRLPFLSKSKALGTMQESWIGQCLDVDIDSLNEGCGLFIRISVLLDVLNF